MTKYSAKVHITEDYDTGEMTILLQMFKDQKPDTAYVLDSVDVYEETKSRALWKAMEN